MAAVVRPGISYRPGNLDVRQSRTRNTYSDQRFARGFDLGFRSDRRPQFVTSSLNGRPFTSPIGRGALPKRHVKIGFTNAMRKVCVMMSWMVGLGVVPMVYITQCANIHRNTLEIRQLHANIGDARAQCNYLNAKVASLQGSAYVSGQAQKIGMISGGPTIHLDPSTYLASRQPNTETFVASAK